MSQVENTPYALVSYDRNCKNIGQHIKCPCGTDLEEHDLLTEEWISHPMIWCDVCNGRYFLDYVSDEDDEYDSDPNENDEPNIHIDLRLHEKVGLVKNLFKSYDKEEANNPVYKIPVCFINKVGGSNMSNVRAAKKLSRNKIDRLAEAGLFHINSKKYDKIKDPCILSKLIKKYDIMVYLLDDDVDKKDTKFMDENDIKYKIYDSDDYMDRPAKNIMIGCHSYNVFKPAQRYPKYIDIGHDGGAIVTCEIVHQNKKKIAKFWGG